MSHTRGLVVDPAIVIASPMEGTHRANRQHTATISNVTMRLIFLLGNLFAPKSSSNESLAGRTHNGVAVMAAKSIVKFPYKLSHY
jgi:hypothetical protein